MKTLPEDTFAEYLNYAHPGPVIPGLFQAAIPQGLAYLPEADLFLISNYMFDGRTAALTLTPAYPSPGDYVYPDFFISIPNEVQGAAFIRDHIVLSRSYGRTNNSRLSVYKSPLDEPPDHTFAFPNGRTVPVYLLDESRHRNTISAPPMTEGISVFSGTLALLFESAADKYRRTARYPQDRIHLISADIISSR